jgi:hypothetical protein
MPHVENPALDAGLVFLCASQIRSAPELLLQRLQGKDRHDAHRLESAVHRKGPQAQRAEGGVLFYAVYGVE